jgi:hypothetical protein
MNNAERLRNELLQRFPTIDSPRSVFMEDDPTRTRIVLHQAAKQVGIMITTRIIGNALIVWRMK